MTDDQGDHDVGFNGLTEFKTSNLDRIAAQGVVFTDAHVTYAVCGPSRAGFMSGRYPQRHGFERNPAWKPEDSTWASRSIFTQLSRPLTICLPTKSAPLDGVNLMPFIAAENAIAPHEHLYLRILNNGAFAIRTDDHKIVRVRADQTI